MLIDVIGGLHKDFFFFYCFFQIVYKFQIFQREHITFIKLKTNF